MTGEKFTISGSLSFTGTVRGIRGDLEREAENIKMELSLIAKKSFLNIPGMLANRSQYIRKSLTDW